MIIDGKAIAADLEEGLRRSLVRFTISPTLAIIVVGKNPVIESFVRIKKRVGERLGIVVVERYFDNSLSGEELKYAIKTLAADPTIGGIVVQLPLPEHIDAQAMLNAVPIEKDVDMLSVSAMACFASGDAKILPPVAAAIQEILERTQTRVALRDVLVLGHGRLVGRPASILLRHNSAHVTVVDQEISDLSLCTRESAIIISGVGKPGLIVPEMLAQGVVLIDAGTSESGGKIVGDADPRCAEVASVFTPVPGGVGPIAVTMIFKNLCVLAKK